MDKFYNKIYCIIFATDIPKNKKYILSTKPDSIEFINTYIEQNNVNHLEDSLVSYIKQYVFVSDLELLPQLISINNPSLSRDIDTINIVYGFVVNHTNNINNAHWIEFDYMQESQYSNVLFEVIRKLQ